MIVTRNKSQALAAILAVAFMFNSVVATQAQAQTQGQLTTNEIVSHPDLSQLERRDSSTNRVPVLCPLPPCRRVRMCHAPRGGGCVALGRRVDRDRF